MESNPKNIIGQCILNTRAFGEPSSEEMALNIIDDLAERGWHIVRSSSEFLLLPLPPPDATFAAVQDAIEKRQIETEGGHPGGIWSVGVTEAVFEALTPSPEQNPGDDA